MAFFGWRGVVLSGSRCPYTVDRGYAEEVGDLLDGLVAGVVELLGERGLVGGESTSGGISADARYGR